MDIAVIAAGSRGDVQPPTALASGLAARGHKVRLIVPREFAPLAEQRGVEFCGLDGDMRQMVGEIIDGDQNPVAVLRDLIAGYRQVSSQWAALLRDFARGADLIVGIGAGSFGASVLAEALDVPLVIGFLLPVIPTALLPSPAFPAVRTDLPGWVNRLEHVLAFELLWQFLHRALAVVAARRSGADCGEPVSGSHAARVARPR